MDDGGPGPDPIGSGHVEFGQLLRRFRLRAGLTQEKLALKVFGNTRKSSIGELENDLKRVPQLTTIKRLAEAFDLSGEERSLLAAAADRRRIHANAARSSMSMDASMSEPIRGRSEVSGNAATDTFQPVFVDPTEQSPATHAGGEGAPKGRSTSRRTWLIAGAVIVAVLVGTLVVVRGGEQSTSSVEQTPLPSTGQEPAAGGTTIGGDSAAAQVLPITTTGTASAAIPSANIRSPVDGEAVESHPTVNGTAHLAGDQVLWLVLHPVTDTKYYPTTQVPLTVEADGSWVTRPRIGRGPQDAGYDFDLFMVVSPRGGMIEQETAKRPPDQWVAHLDAIPTDATVTDRIRITLGQ